ncbi:exoribonuclease [Escherichia coli]|nr:exoribonuclease [Escherichia coli]EEV6139357.1 exoribonuclease [Escherichia coli]EFC4369133.1 exoribonuclease [Escherichia coli]EFC6967054.1 exoribonuclease [Escherichia coli]EFE2080569.1 exoribonuclease [Escherichia coli]
MNNDELATRRAQAIAEDRCFSKGRLRDEFRINPCRDHSDRAQRHFHR